VCDYLCYGGRASDWMEEREHAVLTVQCMERMMGQNGG
jgi:hypothetical protein